MYHSLGISLQPFIINYFTLIDLIILLRCLGSIGGNRHSAIREVTTTLLKQLPRPIPYGNTHTWHVGHSHVNRGLLSTRGHFYWLSRGHSQHVTINTGITWNTHTWSIIIATDNLKAIYVKGMSTLLDFLLKV